LELCGIYSFKIGAAPRTWVHLTRVWRAFLTD